ncbi:COG2346 Truncated hemoglobins [Burkholderiaceae bacterium]
MQAMTPYNALGGADAVRALVDRFYELMDEWPETFALRQMHPADLGHARQSLYEFLSGWLGGPALYIEKNGHPRLRMRHMPYAIGYAERDQWMMCMRTALTERVSDPDLRAALVGAFAQMADHMVNVSAASPATPSNPLESR